MAPAGCEGPERSKSFDRGRTVSISLSQSASRGKAIQAYLTIHQVGFRKTHDLTDLGSQCVEIDASLEPVLRAVEGLTDYTSAFRYPDAPYEPDANETKEALAIASALCDEVRRRIDSLPRT